MLKNSDSLTCFPSRSRGFTLVELVVGLVITGFSLAFLAVAVFPLFTRSVEPIFAIRAAELGQAVIEDIRARRYDELTPVGGVPSCSPCSVSLGSDAGESGRELYDDVDDYNSFCEAINSVEDVLGNAPTGFDNYGLTICVVYDGDFDGSNDGSSANAKLINVSVYPPSTSGGGYDTPIKFSSYRGNY